MLYRHLSTPIAGDDEVATFKYPSHSPQIVQVAGRTISKYSIVLLVIVLTGLFLRLYDLGSQSLWFDEAFSVWISKMGLSQMVQVAELDVHPPLYYFILHYWITLFGTSEVAVRSLSVLFGVLAIPVIYVLGRRLFKEGVGLLAALILAFSTFNVQYSQEARMYTLMVLLALLSMYFFILFLQRNTVIISVGYVVCTTLLLYTHVYGVFVVIAQNVYLLTLLILSRERAFRLRHWIALQVLVVAFFAPWIRFLTSQISGVEGGYWVPPPTINALILTLATYAGASTATYTRTGMQVLLFLVLSALSLFTYRKLRGSVDWKAPLRTVKNYTWEVGFTKDYIALYFLAVWLLAINAIPYIISLFSQPIYFTRFTIAGSIALYLIVAKGISHINYRYAKVAVVIVIVALSAVTLQTYYTTPTKAQARDATSFINENAKDGDLVLLFPSSAYLGPMLNYYSFGAGLNVSKFPSSSAGQGLTGNIKELQSDINGQSRVWLMVQPGSDPQILNQTMKTIASSYNETNHKSYYGYEVYLFDKRV